MNGTYYPNGKFNEENIFNFKKGQIIKIYISNNTLEGTIEDLANDYIIINNPTTNKWNLVPIKNINYIEFEALEKE